MKHIKKTMAILLAVFLLLSVTPVFSIAADVVDSGTCGANLTWTLDSEGTLSIDGTGKMGDWDEAIDPPPWDSYSASIKTVQIGDGVTYIGEHAFVGHAAIEHITIGSSVASIGLGAFAGCLVLKSIAVSADNGCFASDEFGCLYNKDMTTLLQYPIGNKQNSFIVPDHVTRIGDYSFSYSASLEGIVIQDGVTDIGEAAFMSCHALKYIEIPESVKVIGDRAFEFCDSLKNITIPDGVTSIGNDAFFECSALKTIEIPESVEVIGERAFDFCDALESIIVNPNNPYYASDDSGCLYNKDKSTLIRYPIGNKQTSFVVPDSVTSIRERAFRDCSNLENVVLSSGVTSIEWFVFGGTAIKNIVIPDNVTLIREWAFGSALESIVLGKNIKTIEGGAFQFCSNLKDVYYNGCKFNWSDIIVDDNNEPLLNATLHLLDHTPGEVVKENEVAPTCTAAGSYDDVTYCTVCGNESSRVTVTVDALGHIDEANDGLCDRCGEKMTGDGHCGYCGKIHEGFPEMLVGWFHTFLNLFKTNKPEELIELTNEGVQDGTSLFKSMLSGASDLASSVAKAVDSIQKTLIPIVEFFGKVTATFQNDA